VDCTASLTDALVLGDKYDVPFFRGLWKLAILDLADKGGEHALMAFSAACYAGDNTLAKAALKQCKGISNPLRFPTSKVERMGWKAWLQIVRAWDSAFLFSGNKAFRHNAISFDKDYSWAELGDRLRLDADVSSRILRSRI
jgi:hypothetical protein